MKALKIIGAIILLLLVVALFMPSELGLSRTITINKSQEIVFNHVHDLNSYIKWNPWSPKEPSAKTIVSEDGSRYSWKGTDDGIGVGYLQHKSNEKFSAITNDLVFKSPMESTATTSWTFENADGATNVTWSFVSELPYPMTLMQPMIQGDMEATLALDFEQGLKNLKALVEAYEAPTDSTMMDSDDAFDEDEAK